ncbi:hypothetical protein T484DRAFT_1763411 [Baffinella frigidus]|nr:hypothetical protein T484DRAFT_1763411 [Cryptophyta sp. CCMP2293]
MLRMVLPSVGAGDAASARSVGCFSGWFMSPTRAQEEEGGLSVVAMLGHVGDQKHAAGVEARAPSQQRHAAWVSEGALTAEAENTAAVENKERNPEPWGVDTKPETTAKAEVSEGAAAARPVGSDDDKVFYDSVSISRSNSVSRSLSLSLAELEDEEALTHTSSDTDFMSVPEYLLVPGLQQDDEVALCEMKQLAISHRLQSAPSVYSAQQTLMQVSHSSEPARRRPGTVPPPRLHPTAPRRPGTVPPPRFLVRDPSTLLASSRRITLLTEMATDLVGEFPRHELSRGRDATADVGAIGGNGLSVTPTERPTVPTFAARSRDHQPSEVDQIEAGACSNSSGGTSENECATRGNGSKQSSIREDLKDHTTMHRGLTIMHDRDAGSQERVSLMARIETDLQELERGL